MSDTDVFVGWAHVGLPVMTGPAPEGARSLAMLAGQPTFEQLLSALLAVTEARRQAALTIIHYAAYAVTSVLLAPLLVDGVALDVEPAQIGVVLDAEAMVTALWLGGAGRRDRAEAAHAGAQALALLSPIAEQARRAGHVSPYAVGSIMLDALIAGCRSVARAAGREAAPLVEALISAGQPGYRPARRLLARPDAGPPVALYVPRYCCVLHRTPGEHACPTCPRYPDDATRLRMIDAWLGRLDDDGFRATTGRARVAGMFGIDVATR